jgi:hypothetical protein
MVSLGEKPTMAMHSRVSYIAYIGGLDLGLAHVLAREIGKRIEVPAGRVPLSLVHRRTSVSWVQELCLYSTAKSTSGTWRTLLFGRSIPQSSSWAVGGTRW